MKNINDLRADWLAYHQIYDLGFEDKARAGYKAFEEEVGDDFEFLDALFEAEQNGAPGLVVTNIWSSGKATAKLYDAFCRKYGITAYFVTATSTALMEYLTEAIKAGWQVTGTVTIPRPFGIGTTTIEEPALKLELNA